MKNTYSKQAIKTKYLGATNSRGARVKATCEAGTLTQSWDYDLSPESNHESVRKALQLKLAKNRNGDIDYLNHRLNDPWLRPMVGGALPNNEGYAFVFVGGWE
jgi:hypothetical protein